MSLPPTTGALHQLAADARADGATHIHAAAIIEHSGRILLLARGGDGFLDATWQPPTALLLTGDTFHDALHRSLAHTGLTIGKVTGYLGYHDQKLGIDLTRTFAFAVAVPDPDGVCHTSTICHLWTHPDQLPDNTEPPPRQLTKLLGTHTAGMSSCAEPPLAAPLRAHARGLYPAEAAAELLINHAAWLHRNDFTTRFVQRGSDSGLVDPTNTAVIDWPATITALDAGQLPCSGGEGRILRLAASLAEGVPVDLRDITTGLDEHNITLLRQAVLHASGQRPST